jgi:hypothetical protein
MCCLSNILHTYNMVGVCTIGKMHYVHYISKCVTVCVMLFVESSHLRYK